MNLNKKTCFWNFVKTPKFNVDVIHSLFVTLFNLSICDFRPTLKNWEKINGSVLYPAKNSKAPISFGNIFSTNTVKKLTK